MDWTFCISCLQRQLGTDQNPLVLTSCGHPFCVHCSAALANPAAAICPFCNVPCSSITVRSIDEVPAEVKIFFEDPEAVMRRARELMETSTKVVHWHRSLQNILLQRACTLPPPPGAAHLPAFFPPTQPLPTPASIRPLNTTSFRDLPSRAAAPSTAPSSAFQPSQPLNPSFFGSTTASTQSTVKPFGGIAHSRANKPAPRCDPPVGSQPSFFGTKTPYSQATIAHMAAAISTDYAKPAPMQRAPLPQPMPKRNPGRSSFSEPSATDVLSFSNILMGEKKDFEGFVHRRQKELDEKMDDEYRQEVLQEQTQPSASVRGDDQMDTSDSRPLNDSHVGFLPPEELSPSLRSISTNSSVTVSSSPPHTPPLSPNTSTDRFSSLRPRPRTPATNSPPRPAEIRQALPQVPIPRPELEREE